MKKGICLLVLSWLAIVGTAAYAQDPQQGKNVQETVESITCKNLSVEFFEVREKSESGFKPMTAKSVSSKRRLQPTSRIAGPPKPSA